MEAIIVDLVTLSYVRYSSGYVIEDYHGLIEISVVLRCRKYC